MKLILMLLVVSLGTQVAVATEEQAQVPFKLIDGWAVLAQGSISGRGKQNFIIDTGAVPSAVNVKLVKKLGLIGSTNKVSVFSGTVNSERVRVPNVQIGPVAAESLEMVALDFSHAEEELGVHIDALVGLDLLGKQSFSIDYRAKVLSFGPPAPVDGSIRFQLAGGGSPYLLVPVKANGQWVRLLLDTGVKNVMLFRPQLSGALRELHAVRQDNVTNAGGNDTVQEVRLASVSRGGRDFSKTPAFVWNTASSAMRDFDGMLGPAAFGTTRLDFDFEHGSLYWGTR